MPDEMRNAPVTPELIKALEPLMPGASLDVMVKTARDVREASAESLKLENVRPEAAGLIKGMAPDYGALGGALNDIKAALADLGKDITFGANLPTTLGLQLFDLSGPARQLYPVMSPIRNKLPRTGGVGGGHLVKIISAISGSGTGQADVSPFISASSIPAEGSATARGAAIAQTTQDVIVGYKFAALQHGVTMPAFFAGQGFQDLRGLVATQLMQAGFLQEEKALLMGRDAVLTAPSAPTLTQRAPVSGETGIVGTGSGGTVVRVTTTAVGPFGETAMSTSTTSTIAQSSTRVIDVSIGTANLGDLAYNVYVSYADAGGTPSTTVLYRDGTAGYNSFTIGTNGRITTGSTGPTSDSGTGSSNSYRGLIQAIEEGPASGTSVTGYVKRLNAKLSGTSINEFQAMFASLWNATKASPDEIWTNARERKDAGELIMTATSSPYRLGYSPDQQGQVIAGVIVPTVWNESASKETKFSVHPWLPVGNALALQYQLPFPTAYGSNVGMEVVNVQDYMQIAWPQTSLTWLSSIVWFGTLAVYAPSFCGVIHGIAHETDTAVGSLA